MKKQTIKCIAASLAIMGCISSIPQRVLASIDDISVANVSSTVNHKNKDKDGCGCKEDKKEEKKDGCKKEEVKEKKDDCKKEEKRESIFSEENKKYLSKDQCTKLEEVKKCREKGDKLTKEQEDFLRNVVDCIIKGKLGDKNYKEYQDLMKKKDSGAKLSDAENKRLKEIIDMINTAKTSVTAKNFLKDFLR